MRIYAMTATFGKLEHETLQLQPGLNILEAPNEWGKSTWCAFLVTMLYGLDTRARSTADALAEKEHYAPWSGSPMSGRMELNWNGRDITIERWTRGRTPMGEFRAYETATGLDVPELTKDNCGNLLLGVERSVFTRAGFLRLTDLPVSQDESLRRRLNALVTTGDESGAGDELAVRLKELKNRCRHNRTGLLPQAEAELTRVEGDLAELRDLQAQSVKIHGRLEELDNRRAKLENHRDALMYAAAEADSARVAQAQQAADAAEQALAEAESRCAKLPGQREAEIALRNLRLLEQRRAELETEAHMLPPEPEKPIPPALYAGVSPEDAAASAQADRDSARELKKNIKKQPVWLYITAAMLLAVGVGLILTDLVPVWVGWTSLSLSAAVLIAAAVIGIQRVKKNGAIRERLAILAARYGTEDTGAWMDGAMQYASAQQEFDAAMEAYLAERGDLDQRTEDNRRRIAEAVGTKTMPEMLDILEKVCREWIACGDARREYQRARSNAEMTRAMARTAQMPSFPDELAFSEAETARLLSDSGAEIRNLQRQLGQAQGRMEHLGREEDLAAQAAALRSRIRKLEETYTALDYAQKALAAASAELQRRFAPRISARAQELFAQLTGGRYERLSMGDDLSLSAAADGEDTLHAARWRSDGTIDQTYLALRLAVAEELTPDAPLVLDDALVRFDDIRLAAAMDILAAEAECKQVLLFTCQSREAQYRKTEEDA